jgi:hypothetical protein
MCLPRGAGVPWHLKTKGWVHAMSAKSSPPRCSNRRQLVHYSGRDLADVFQSKVLHVPRYMSDPCMMLHPAVCCALMPAMDGLISCVVQGSDQMCRTHSRVLFQWTGQLQYQITTFSNLNKLTSEAIMLP